jgi:protein involved in polysaccharide export with SLBB domain
MSIKIVGEGLRRWALVCGLVVGGLCLVGCRTQPSHTATAERPSDVASANVPGSASATNSLVDPATTIAGGIEPDILRVGDSLQVAFTDTPTPIPPFEEKIKEDGTITLLLNQTFVAAGTTPGDLGRDIRKRYVPDYFKLMTVTVKHQESTRWYYVDGEVRSPNRQIYNSRITVSKAIASAGGFTDFANKKKVKLTRVDGRTQIVNCPKALDNPKLDPEVYPGDKINVPRRLW